MNKISLFFSKYYLRILICSLLIAICLFPGVGKVTTDFGLRNWFIKGDSTIKELDEFEKRFGSDQKLLILIKNEKGIFNNQSIELLRELTESMWKVRDILRVDSLANFSFSTAKNDEILIEPLVKEEGSLTSEELAQLKTKSLSHELLPGFLVNKEGTALAVLATARNYFKEKDQYVEIYKETLELVKKFETPEHQIHVTGAIASKAAFKMYSAGDMQKLMPGLFLVIIVLLYLLYRNWVGVVLPLITIILCLYSTTAISGFLGVAYDNLSSISPLILTSICIADVVHILTIYYLHNFRTDNHIESIEVTIKKNFLPTLITSITTMIGFLSLVPTPLLPIRNLGLMSAIGTILGWLISFGVAIPILYFLKNNKVSSKSLLVRYNKRRKNKVFGSNNTRYVWGFFTLTFIAAYLGLTNDINYNPLNNFSEDTQITQATNTTVEDFGGASGPEIVIDTGVPGGSNDPQILKKVDQLKKWLNSDSNISSVFSIVDIVKDMNQTFSNDEPGSYIIPNDSQKVAQMIFMYNMGLPQGANLNDRVSFDGRYIRISVLWKYHYTKEILAKVEVINNKIKELGLNGHVAGSAHIFGIVQNYIVDTFYSSMLLAVILVTLTLMILFKSVKVGLLSLVPNVSPILFGFGFLKLLGESINLGSAMVTSVCLGIIVDDTIHFLSTYITSRKNGLTVDDAINETLNGTGVSLIMTTIILISGFSVFHFGDLLQNRFFGLLCSFIIGFAILADLYFLPKFLKFLNEKNIKV